MTTKELINQYVTAHADNRWMDASELETLLTEFAEKLKVPASDDLVDAINNYFLNARIYICEAYKAGVEWQRERMMKDAIVGEVSGIGPLTNGNLTDPQKKTRRLSAIYSFKNTPYCELGDEVKVIIIKE